MTFEQKPRVNHLFTDKTVKFHPFPGDDIWSFYYFIPTAAKTENSFKHWRVGLRRVCDFSTFEDFYALLNTIQKPWDLYTGCKYFVFRYGILPQWEDDENRGGTILEFHIDNKSSKGKFYSSEACVKFHKHSTLKVLGRIFEESDFINGIEFCNRGGVSKVSFWIKRSDKEVADVIENKLRDDLMKIVSELEEKEGGTEGKRFTVSRKIAGVRRPSRFNSRYN